jgi:hypothetical protein
MGAGLLSLVASQLAIRQSNFCSISGDIVASTDLERVSLGVSARY